MDTGKKVIALRDASAMKRVILPTEVPVSVVDVAAFVRALFEPEIQAMIEAVQDQTLDD